jgi:hypothetical protein
MGSSIAFPENLDLLSAKILEGWGGDYVKRLSQYDATALRITDKMPANYMALGLIHLMLPQAKIIHVKRNPIDTCVSCFTRLFNRHQEATYDLVELGQHYVRYSELMKHWKEVLPPGSFIEVDYEAIVDNIEEQARRLVEGCGLEWDEGCLSFYCSKRAVRTASLTQVRQPIYRGSVERWRHYESYLGPLINELQPVL